MSKQKKKSSQIGSLVSGCTVVLIYILLVVNEGVSKVYVISVRNIPCESNGQESDSLGPQLSAHLTTLIGQRRKSGAERGAVGVK